eukprot:TRINITY_DN14854_c0_g1_i1.p1 TRINITY_DN14854_c0_g1~~TRINITY_DN14854_c0_g1_i1.p1  ORF type:complete len:318 (-),score=72.73 TRINITY_DN14854_c0_g1_i1:124-1077(-)
MSFLEEDEHRRIERLRENQRDLERDDQYKSYVRSRDKARSTLGMEEEDLISLQEEKIRRLEEEAERKRCIERPRDKRNAVKALEVLGEDPSLLKIQRMMGIGEEEIRQAQLETIQREEEQIAQKRKNLPSVTKRNAQKALEILGVDPSREKLKSTLGIDEEMLAAIEQERIEDYYERLERTRSNSLNKNRSNSKAFKILGVDPSVLKISEYLGIDEDEVYKAEDEINQQKEELIRQARSSIAQKNRRNTRKALKVLGHNPSQSKLEYQLGEHWDTIVGHLDHPLPVNSGLRTVTTFLAMGIFLFGVHYITTRTASTL